MLTDGHIFTIKTKDEANVADIKKGGKGIVITGLNVLRDQIKVGDFVFVVFGGDKPKGWTPGLVGVAHISREPYTTSEDDGKNFRVEIDIDVYFEPSILRKDLITYPKTFGIIGIAPIVKWEPNQAITSVEKEKAVALIQAICELRTSAFPLIKNLLGEAFKEIDQQVTRFVYKQDDFSCKRIDLREEFIAWAPFKKPVRGKTASQETLRKYVSYLGCFEEPMSNEGKHCGSGWNGVIEFITGHRQNKEFYQIESVEDFDNEFGIVKGIFNGNPPPEGVNADNYNKVLEWASTEYFKKHACFESAYDAYCEFLQWREAQNEDKGDGIKVERRYWLIAPGENAKFWEDWTKSGVATIGWSFLGDLKDQERAAIQTAIDAEAGDGKSHTNNSLCCWQFSHEMAFGDVIIAKRGTGELLGLGFVDGDYSFGDACGNHKHYRKVRWIKTGVFASKVVLDRKTLTDITPYPDYLMKILESMEIDPLTLENHNKPEQPIEPPNIDKLTIALKLFKEHRYDEAWQKNVTESKAVDAQAWTNKTAAEFKDLPREELVDKLLSEMWSYKNGGCRAFAQVKDDDYNTFRDFIVELRTNIKTPDSYFPASTKCPKGIGEAMLTEFMMRFYPEVYSAYNSKYIGSALKTLGLIDDEIGELSSAAVYQEFMGKTSTILSKMHKMNIPRTPAVGNTDKANYITVNEFFWFVNDYKDLIKEKVMAKAAKNPTDKKKDGKKTLKNLIGENIDSMMSRLAAALLTKPFAILAGASGTGKSRMVRQLAYMTCLNEDLQDKTAPGNYLLVQVKPNWHDSSDLLGYRSAIEKDTYVTTEFVKFVLKAHAYPQTPFFVCLDEMNLAPVEQYFAEYLSASEDVKKLDDGRWISAPIINKSDFDGQLANLAPEYNLDAATKAIIEEKGLVLPHNLYIVGTVNMDDTTCQFSRKVLDRAMTIEMNEVKLDTLLEKDTMSFDELLMTEDEIKHFANREEFNGEKLNNEEGKAFIDKIEALRKVLESTPFAIAYRFAKEAALYRNAVELIGGDAAKDEIALDHMAMMKILPRLTGTTMERAKVIEDLEKAFGELGRSLSKDKLATMVKSAESNGDYISFWP